MTVTVAPNAIHSNTAASTRSAMKDCLALSSFPLDARGMPPAIDAGQIYYWSMAWQRDQARAEAELAAGQGRSFDTGEDAIRWLLSTDS